MKHLKPFNSALLTSLVNESLSMELPEGYAIDVFNPNKKGDAMEYYETAGVADWSGLSFGEWVNSLDQLGPIEYIGGKQYFRGAIEWPEMGISYIYEIHPL
jgi:hypothetical protein